MKADDQKNLKIGIGVAAVAILGYFIFTGSDNGQGYGDDPTGNNTMPSNPNNPNAPVQTVFDAKLAAEKLYNAMREMGTDEKAIMQVFQGVSVANFSKVYHAFGKRAYNKQMGNQYNFNPFFDLPLLTLTDWIKNELSSSSTETVRTKYKSTNLI